MDIDQNTINKANILLTSYLKNYSPLNYDRQAENYIKKNPNIEIFEEHPLIEHPIRRFILNVFYQLGIEKHNKQFSFWIKFLVFIESILVPIQKKLHLIVESFFLRTVTTLPCKYDFYAIQFSPESSINTPDPEFIDQLMVIKRILFDDTRNNKPLLVKEHPAMYMKRPLSFYKELLKFPNLRIVSSKLNTMDLIKGADITYTVNGTVSVEAYIKGYSYEMFGHNFLISLPKSISQEELISRLVLVSEEFVLYSPPIKFNNRFKRLFSKDNVANMANCIDKTIVLSQ